MGIFDLLFRKKSAPVTSAPKKIDEQLPPAPEFKVAVTVEQKPKGSKPACELSHLDFGKPAGELGCFLNYRNYRVLCTDQQGKRRSRERTGIDEQHAIDKVAAEGYLPPYKANPLEYYPPSEKQLDYLKDLGVFIPDGITNVDASCMISRATGEDSEKGPSPSLVALAVGLKTNFSAFVGPGALFFDIIEQASDRDRVALYAYGVRQSMCGGSFENMLEDPDLSVFYAFADKILADEKLLRSLKGRDPLDYRKPNRGTAIYKVAETYLTGGGV